jgi:Glycosyl transferase family 2
MRSLPLPRELPAARTGGHLVEVVVPVHNEEHVLEASIRRLHGYLTDSFPFPFRITIADNASSDGTWLLARRLAERFAEVRAVHLAQKGRGRALREVWEASDADVVAYMDVDLSTGLEALLPLVAPLVSGHSDLAIGTRRRCSRPSRTRPGSSTPSCCWPPSAAASASTRCRSTGSRTPTAGSTSSGPPSTTCAAWPGWPAASSRSGCCGPSPGP